MQIEHFQVWLANRENVKDDWLLIERLIKKGRKKNHFKENLLNNDPPYIEAIDILIAMITQISMEI